MWLKLAPEVRRAVLHFQSIVATRNDLGTLASIQNKFVRLGLVRLRLSLQEFLGELPPETETLFAELIKPDAGAPVRLFLPTRPSMLGKGETVRVTLVVTGLAPVQRVEVHTRAFGAAKWTTAQARLAGRRTYHVELGPFDTSAPLVEYYASASIGGEQVVSPPEGARRPFAVTIA